MLTQGNNKVANPMLTPEILSGQHMKNVNLVLGSAQSGRGWQLDFDRPGNGLFLLGMWLRHQWGPFTILSTARLLDE